MERPAALTMGSWPPAPGSIVLLTFLMLAIAGIMRFVLNPRAESYKRGVQLIEARGLRGRAARLARTHRADLSVAGVAIPLLDETKHFKFIGTTGTGKSTAIRELLGAAIRR